MKKTIIFLLLISGLATASQAQQQPTIPKGATTIIITPTDTADIFKQCMILLVKSGYSIKNTDVTAGIITTEYKPIKGYDLSIRITILDGRIYARGNFRIEFVSGGQISYVDYDTKYTSSYYKKGFLQTIANLSPLGAQAYQ